jgi:hypothetical protein
MIELPNKNKTTAIKKSPKNSNTSTTKKAPELTHVSPRKFK